MKTILIKPNGKSAQYGKVKVLSAIEPPLWIASLANYYNSNYIIDAELDDLTDREVLAELDEINPNKVIIIGSGSHPSAYIQQKDSVERLELLLKQHNINVESYSYLPVNPIECGRPRLDLLRLEDYRAHNWHSWTNYNIASPYGVLFTSISCPFSCEFCAIKSFYGEKYMERSLEDIYYDLDIFAKRKIKNIKIIDELFIYKEDRIKKICQYIINNNYDFNIWAYARIDIMNEDLLKIMKKAGINWLAYGIESGNEDIRRLVTKGSFTNNKIKEVIKMTKDNNIACIGNYMLGFWEDTIFTMQQTIDFAKELNCEYANIYCVVAYPGSKLYENMKNKGISLPNTWTQYAQMSPEFLPLPTKYVFAQEVLKFRDNAFIEYHTRPEYLSMMKDKFGQHIVDSINKMTSIKIERKYA